jgi:hypothetical protein
MFAGLYLLAQRQFDGRPIAPGDVMDGFDVFWPAWGVAVLMALLSAIAGGLVLGAGILAMALGSALDLPEALQMIPFLGVSMLMQFGWVAVGGFFLFTYPLVAEGYGTRDAILLSVEKVRPQLWSFVGIWFVFYMIGAAGSYLCYVGMLITFPIYICGQIAVYRSHFGRLYRVAAAVDGGPDAGREGVE